MTTKCTSCGAPIVWAETRSGRKIPLDPGPIENGNVEYLPSVGRAFIHVRWHLWTPLPNAIRTRAHFVTCLHASKHRARKARLS
jgi:hypothetical protein